MKNRKPVITVIGSINMDLVVTVNKRPRKGETVLGEKFTYNPGGKGANQAVAVARLGAQVNMIGKVGDDEFGNILMNNLKQEGVSTDAIQSISDVSSGVAFITLAESDNSIIVVPGANNYVSPAYIEEHSQLIANSDIVLVQMEIPIETVQETIKQCSYYNIPIVVNPAPAQQLQLDLLQQATFITPNEMEREVMLPGKEEQLLQEWPNKLIITKGKEGVVYHNGTNLVKVPAYRIPPIDTTGAGDTFNGAFAYFYALEQNVENACYYANAAAALSIQEIGAQAGMPSHEAIKAFLSKKGNNKKSD